MDAAGEESADGQHHGARPKLDARDRHHAAHAFALDDEIAAFLLEEREVRLVLERVTDKRLVELAIGLHARRAHRRTLAGIQRARLDRGRIRGARHHAAERIDLLDEMSLADAADGRIAAHLAQRLDRLREQQRARTHPRRRQGGLGTGVSAADHDYVKCGCSGPRKFRQINS